MQKKWIRKNVHEGHKCQKSDFLDNQTWEERSSKIFKDPVSWIFF
jgi:hypothetical protein